MRIEYDPEAKAAYIYLKDGDYAARSKYSKEINDEIILDYDINNDVIRWLIDKINLYLSDWEFDDNVIITSFSTGKEILDETKNIFEDMESSFYRKTNLSYESPDNLDFIFENSLIRCEERDRRNYFVEQFIENTSINFLNTPIPKSFKSINAYDYRWIVDIKINSASSIKDTKGGYYLPPLSIYSKDIFTENVGSMYNSNSTVRFTGDCVSFVCPNMGLIDNPNVETQTVAPRIKLLDEKEIFERAFESINYGVRNSDKGNYMRESINLFGSLENLCKCISDENINNMFDHYKSKLEGEKRKEKDIKGAHVIDRSYLNFEDIKSFISNDKQTRELIDSFLLKGVFYRGFILLCTKCRNADWYSFNDIQEDFICKRCKSKQIYLHENWKMPYEPKIYYQLNEVFYQGLVHNMKLPLLTLNYLKKQSNYSFIFSSELRLFNKAKNNSKNDIEIDIICVSDGELLIGEAKINEELPKKLNLYNEISNKLNCRFILSTYAETWSTTNKRKVDENIWNKPPIFISKNDLINS